MALVLPPNEVFVSPRLPLDKSQGGYGAHGWRQTVCPPDGGMFAYYDEHPYPRKGHTYPEACEANNIVKKLTIGSIVSIASPYAILPVLGFLVTPWRFKIRWMEKVLFNYVRMSDYANRMHYMKKQYYTKMGKELWDLIAHFLRNLGISAVVADGCGRIAAHLLEHDDAYRYRVQDIFTEMSKPHMMASPESEISRLVKIYLQREGSGISEKFTSIAKILSIVIKVPKIRKAFLTALEATEIENLRLDEADSYFCRQRDDYDFQGEDKEVRVKKFINDFNKFALKRFKDQVAESVKSPEALANLQRQLKAFGIN